MWFAPFGRRRRAWHGRSRRTPLQMQPLRKLKSRRDASRTDRSYSMCEHDDGARERGRLIAIVRSVYGCVLDGFSDVRAGTGIHYSTVFCSLPAYGMITNVKSVNNVVILILFYF